MHRTEQKMLIAQVRTLPIENEIKIFFYCSCLYFFLFIALVFILFVGACVL